MKKITSFLTLLLLTGLLVSESIAQDGMVTLESTYSAEETTNRLESALTENGLTIFRKVDHQEGASSVDMELSPTIVFIFGNPKLGTPLMQCEPKVAIDLPQKMLIWEDQNEKVHVGYNSPDYLKRRHNIKGCDQELRKITGALKKIAKTAAGMQ